MATTTTEFPYSFHDAIVVSREAYRESTSSVRISSTGSQKLPPFGPGWIQAEAVSETGHMKHNIPSIQQFMVAHGNNEEGPAANMKCGDSSFNGFAGCKDRVCVSELLPPPPPPLSKRLYQYVKHDVRSDTQQAPAPVSLNVHATMNETRFIVGNKEGPGFRSKMEDMTLIKPSVLTTRILSTRSAARIPTALKQTLSKAVMPSSTDNEDLSLTTERFHMAGVFDGHGGNDVALKLHEMVPEYIRRAVADATTTDPTGEEATATTHSNDLDNEGVSSSEFSRSIDGQEHPMDEETETDCSSQTTGSIAMEVDENPFETRRRSSIGMIDEIRYDKFPVLGLAELEHRLILAFEQLNRDLPDSQEKTVGSTAVVSLISSGYVAVANVGDSRAVMRRNGMSFRVTRDQKPDEEDEEERIQKCGGRIWDFNGRRVMGLLAMTRAFGDDCLKPYGICATPEVTILPRCEQDEFLILACDGLWDVISDEEACCLVQRCFKRAEEREASPMSACRVAASVLFRAAFAKGSNDNISVVVIDLRSNKDAAAAANAME